MRAIRKSLNHVFSAILTHFNPLLHFIYTLIIWFGFYMKCDNGLFSRQVPPPPPGAMTTKECLHYFCHDCIITALRAGNKEWPTCRKKLISKRSLGKDPNFCSLIKKVYIFPLFISPVSIWKSYLIIIVTFFFVIHFCRFPLFTFFI